MFSSSSASSSSAKRVLRDDDPFIPPGDTKRPRKQGLTSASLRVEHLTDDLDESDIDSVGPVAEIGRHFHASSSANEKMDQGTEEAVPRFSASIMQNTSLAGTSSSKVLSAARDVAQATRSELSIEPLIDMSSSDIEPQPPFDYELNAWVRRVNSEIDSSGAELVELEKMREQVKRIEIEFQKAYGATQNSYLNLTFPYEAYPSPICIRLIANLTCLIAKFGKLSLFFPEIVRLANLRSLDLGNNSLKSLPPEIGQLKKLRTLEFEDNDLQSLPPEIGQLTMLEYLAVSRNKLQSLPPEIGQLTMLKYLAVSDNDLKSLPPEIGQLAKLETLDVSDNDLKSLPPEIGQLAKLKEFYLANNDLQSLPLEMSYLTLTKFKAANNKLQAYYAGLRYQIAHEDVVAYEGYDSVRLERIQQMLDEVGIPLHVCPRRAINVHPVDYAKVDDYTNSLPESHKRIFQKVLDNNFTHFTMSMLETELKNCVARFNELIQDQSYVVGFSTGKSSQWIASLALKDLIQLPSGRAALGKNRTYPVEGYKIHALNEPLSLPEDESIPIVIFDDCSFSGSQLDDIKKRIAKNTKTQRTIYFIVPFVSRAAENMIMEPNEKLVIHFIFGNKRIPHIDEGLTQEEKNQLKDLLPELSGKQHVSYLYYFSVSDWRIPDNLPEGFGRRGMRCPPHGGENSEPSKLSEDQFFIAHPGDVPRPYQLSKKTVRAQGGVIYTVE